MDHKEPLAGGNASGTVVRVGDTVRKPWLSTTERTAAYVRALAARGIDVPRVLGRDEEGRQILDFIPGRLAMYDAPLGLATIRRVGALVRSIHEASADLPAPDDWDVLIPAEQPNLLCHNDLATWNLIIDGDRTVFIDWDGAGPSTRLWDLAYAAISFAHLFPDGEPAESAERLAAFANGYGATPALRVELPSAMARRAAAMSELLRQSHESGREPWASMYVDGHGEHWSGTTAYIAEHGDVWRDALSEPSPTDP
ncbi:phosphotransferase [Flexivirga sp. B27]